MKKLILLPFLTLSLSACGPAELEKEKRWDGKLPANIMPEGQDLL